MGSELSAESIERRIYLIRGQKVMLSIDLAILYAVAPKVLGQAVKRNIERFPDDFMFKLSLAESKSLRSQFVTLKRGQHVKHAPYAFAEQGVAMLSSVLRGDRAIQVNIAIMRAFIKLRETLALHKELARRLDDLEMKLGGHDAQIQTVFEVIRRLTNVPEKPRPRIGFRPTDTSGSPVQGHRM